MKTIVIHWQTTPEGVAFAHFPEPFPMDAAEWNAFAGLFDSIGFLPSGQGDTRTAEATADAPRRLADGLLALGYSVEHRGAVPLSIKGIAP